MVGEVMVVVGVAEAGVVVGEIEVEVVEGVVEVGVVVVVEVVDGEGVLAAPSGNVSLVSWCSL